MKKFMGVTSNQTIEDWLKALEKDGFIKRKGEIRRKIMISAMGVKKTKIIQFDQEEKYTKVAAPTVFGTTSYNQSSPFHISSFSRNIQTSTDDSTIFTKKEGDNEGT